MVAGIIVTAAADERMLTEPAAATSDSTAWLVLGGTALFLAGHAAFKATVWRTVPWTRLAAIGVLALLGILATSLSVLALGAAAAAVVVLLAASDRLSPRGAAGPAKSTQLPLLPTATADRTTIAE